MTPDEAAREAARVLTAYRYRGFRLWTFDAAGPRVWCETWNGKGATAPALTVFEACLVAKALVETPAPPQMRVGAVPQVVSSPSARR